jgi:hypothetical protein
MRCSITVTLLLLGVGCQSGRQYTQSGCRSAPCGCATAPAAPAPASPARLPGSILQPVAVKSGLASAAAPMPAGPNQVALVPSHVQTTTTYKRQCDLTMDRLPISIPFPHLRIFQGPDQVVTRTEYVRVPCVPIVSRPSQPAPAQVIVVPKQVEKPRPAVSKPLALPLPDAGLPAVPEPILKQPAPAATPATPIIHIPPTPLLDSARPAVRAEPDPEPPADPLPVIRLEPFTTPAAPAASTIAPQPARRAQLGAVNPASVLTPSRFIPTPPPPPDSSSLPPPPPAGNSSEFVLPPIKK